MLSDSMAEDSSPDPEQGAPQQPAPPVAHPLPPNPPARPQLYLPRAVRRSSERDRDTALHMACSVGAYHEVVMLLLGGHPANPRNVWEETPLHHCAARGHLDVMMALLDSSADVDAGDHQGLTPLHQAIIHGKRDAAELLLCYGASVHGVEGVKNLRSPLELAQHVHVCRDVVDSGLGEGVRGEDGKEGEREGGGVIFAVVFLQIGLVKLC